MEEGAKMGYIDQLVKNHTMHSQDRRVKYQTFVLKTKPRKAGGVVRIDLIRAMAFVGETNFSEAAQLKFISDYNSFHCDDLHPLVMYRTTEPANSHRGWKHSTYIIRLPDRGDKIREAKIDDDSIVVGDSRF